ncbi:AraC family transcriptional regulator [Micromonospora sp. NPDC050495]|uniref:helix-turn-helix transcriptional regulator n=1 Tax=Micromonospora sp. NPDC050495 TaxID=3154936 RepID=UPI003405BC28
MARTPLGGAFDQRLSAWRPSVPGVAEVLHARFLAHAYPAHTHEAWTLLIVDDGMIRYDLNRHDHGAVIPAVTLLPPHVPHDGRTVTEKGFVKRVVYLDAGVVGEALVGAAVDQPTLIDPLLRRRVDQLHRALSCPGEELHAESRLALIVERLRLHLQPAIPALIEPPPRHLARDLRDLLDAHTVTGISLDQAAQQLHAHPTHLVRAFAAAYGLPPHAYLTGRRIDRARSLLLAGRSAAQVANEVGFYDQAHLNRHFKRYLGTTPVRFLRANRQH